MPSCSYQVDKDLNTSASPTSMVGFKSYFSNKYLARPAPCSAPASNQMSPSHHSSHCRFKGSKLPTTAGLMPIYTSALKTLITDAVKCQIAEDDDREQWKITPDTSEQREVKMRHHSAGDTFENNTSPSRSPKLSGKSSPGNWRVNSPGGTPLPTVSPRPRTQMVDSDTWLVSALLQKQRRQSEMGSHRQLQSHHHLLVILATGTEDHQKDPTETKVVKVVAQNFKSFTLYGVICYM